MSETVWLALIAACSGIFTAMISPVVVMVVTSRTRRLEKVEEWRRQDQVASRLVESNKSILTATENSAKTTDLKLDKQAAATAVIHTLVNSTLTEAKKSELRALKGQYVMMQEMKDFRRTLTPPVEITVEGQAELDAIEKKISELETLLNERSKAAKVVEKQLDQQKNEGIGPNNEKVI